METFDSTTGRLVVADGVTDIAPCAYAGREDLREVWLPDSVVRIGYRAFCNCTGIVDLQLPDTLQSIRNHAFSGCTGIVELQLPDTVQSIGDGAFGGCTGIVELQLPATLQSIGIGDEITEEITGNNDTYIINYQDEQWYGTQENYSWYDGAFDGCSSLARVLAPGSLVRGEMADPTIIFEGCPVLATGLTPLSSIRLLRRTLWHPTMHSWCTPGQRMCVLAVLVAELR